MDLGLLEDAPVLSYLLRREGDEFILENVNAAARRHNPLLTSLIGKPMAALYSDQPAVIADAMRCANENVVVEHELAVRRYDKTEATQYVRLRFVPAPPSHMVLFMHEIHNHEIARNALNESEARYQSLVSSLPDAVLLRGADGRVLFCNEQAVELFGATSQADLLGKLDVLAPGLEVRDEAGELVRQSHFPSRRVLATGDTADNRRQTLPPAAAPAAKGTVLVVDDEDAVRRTTARLVQSLGYHVLDASCVAQAVERSSGHPGDIDMLLCDIAMPGEDGRNLAAALLQQRTKLKVVFMSGYSSDMQEMRVHGALFLQKPFSRDELARKLAELQAS